MNTSSENHQNILLGTLPQSELSTLSSSFNDENINQINQQTTTLPNTPHGNKRKLGRTNYLPLVSESS